MTFATAMSITSKESVGEVTAAVADAVGAIVQVAAVPTALVLGVGLEVANLKFNTYEYVCITLKNLWNFTLLE